MCKKSDISADTVVSAGHEAKRVPGFLRLGSEVLTT